MNRDKVTVAQIEVCETAKKMYHSGLVAGTWGNISARVDDEYMVITPSGMDYDRLCPEDMVLVNIKTICRNTDSRSYFQRQTGNERYRTYTL